MNPVETAMCRNDIIDPFVRLTPDLCLISIQRETADVFVDAESFQVHSGDNMYATTEQIRSEIEQSFKLGTL